MRSARTSAPESRTELHRILKQAAFQVCSGREHVLLVVLSLSIEVGRLTAGLGGQMFRRFAAPALLALLSLTLVLSGCGGGAGPTNPQTGPATTPSSSPGAKSLKVFLVKGEVLTTVTRQGNGVEDALKYMIEGPNASEKAQGISTAVPPGTQLLSYSAPGGKATADFSKEMLDYGGGSARVQAIMGQIDKTIQSNDPSITSVAITIEGKPAEEVLQP